MNAINERLAEHEAARLTLRILKKIEQIFDETGKIPNPEHAEQRFDFLSTFVDRCHHFKGESHE